MVKIFVHIGTHKTGTTSIQKFARSNEEKLKMKGFFYPGYSILGKKEHYGHHHIAHALAMQKNNRIDAKTAECFFEKVIKIGEKYDYVFLSAEPFYRHFYGQKTVAQKSNTYWEAREKYIMSLKQCFADHVNKVEIIITIRRQSDFAMSLYKESVKATRYSKTFLDFLDEHWYYFEYFQQIKLWEKIFGKVKLLIFEDLINSGKLVENFFKSLDLDVTGLPIPKIKNESLCPDFFEFKKQINKTAISENQLKTIRHFLEQRNYFWISNYNVNTKELVVESDDLNKFQEKFIVENQRLLEEYFGNRTKLFPDRKYLKNQEYQGLDESRKLGIFVDYLNYLN